MSEKLWNFNEISNSIKQTRVIWSEKIAINTYTHIYVDSGSTYGAALWQEKNN